MPVFPDQVRVIVRDWLNANHVLFLGDENILVDTGYGSHADVTLGLLRQPGHLGTRQLHRIVNTHGHSDHIGGNAYLKRIYGSTISVPAGEAPLISSWDTRALWLDYADQKVERFMYDDVISPGDTLSMGGLSWHAIAAPGHDMGALLFYNPDQRILITGDALWENGFGIILPGSGVEERMDAAEASLKTIAGLDVKAVIPGHGRPFEDVAGALDRAFGRLHLYRREPLRMAKNCVKAIFVFTLLDCGQIKLSDLPEYLASVPLHRDINEACFKLSKQEFADMLLGDLERVGAVQRKDGFVTPGRGGH